MRSALHDASELEIRPDAIGDMVECALISTAPKIVWKREAIAKELKIPARKARAPTLSIEQMARVLDALRTQNLFRFAMVEAGCHRPRFATARRLDDGSLGLPPPGRGRDEEAVAAGTADPLPRRMAALLGTGGCRAPQAARPGRRPPGRCRSTRGLESHA
jgi:hypothetical protein